MQYQTMGRDLITPDEVGGMKGRTCILKIRGCNPFKSQKFDIEKHKNYKQLSDANKDNWYTIEQREQTTKEVFFETILTKYSYCSQMSSRRNISLSFGAEAVNGGQFQRALRKMLKRFYCQILLAACFPTLILL